LSLHIIVTKEELIKNLPLRYREDTKILKAIQMAESAHSGSKRDNGTTYLENHIWHIGKQIIKNYSEDRNFKTLLITGLLHDCIEDSDKFCLKDIEESFGKRIASLVSKLTKDPKREHSNSKIKFEYFKKYIKGIKGSKLALIIKFEDRLANLMTINKSDLEKRREKTLLTMRTTEEILIPLAGQSDFKVNYSSKITDEMNRIERF